MHNSRDIIVGRDAHTVGRQPLDRSDPATSTASSAYADGDRARERL